METRVKTSFIMEQKQKESDKQGKTLLIFFLKKSKTEKSNENQADCYLSDAVDTSTISSGEVPTEHDKRQVSEVKKLLTTIAPSKRNGLRLFLG